MDLSDKVMLETGHLYFYEYDGVVAIGEFFEEFDDEMLWSDESIPAYFAEVWSSDNDISYTTVIEDINILKKIGNAYDQNGKFSVDHTNITKFIDELKPEFPEYFI